MWVYYYDDDYYYYYANAVVTTAIHLRFDSCSTVVRLLIKGH